MRELERGRKTGRQRERESKSGREGGREGGRELIKENATIKGRAKVVYYVFRDGMHKVLRSYPILVEQRNSIRLRERERQGGMEGEMEGGREGERGEGGGEGGREGERVDKSRDCHNYHVQLQLIKAEPELSTMYLEMDAQGAHRFAEATQSL